MTGVDCIGRLTRTNTITMSQPQWTRCRRQTHVLDNHLRSRANLDLFAPMNPKSVSRDQAAVPTVAGRLDTSPIPELLAYALNQQFTGALVLQSSSQERSGVLFSNGSVWRARVAGLDQILARQVLRFAGLSDEDLALATRFARESARDIFTGVGELALLSVESLESARTQFVDRQVRALVTLPPDTAFGFFPDLDTLKKSPGPLQPLAPLDLLIACILEEASIERCRDHLDPIKNEKLKLVESVAIKPDSAVAGLRPVIERIRRGPHSLEDLRLLNLVPEPHLIACIYALRLTRRVAREGSPSGRPSWPGRVPRRNSSQGFAPDPRADLRNTGERERPETLPEVGMPTTYDSEPPARDWGPSERERARQEQAAESKALEAWALAEGGDPVQIRKALLMVEKAVKYFPDNAQIRFYAGCLYRLVRKDDRAAHEFRRVLSLDPDHSQAQHELDLLGRRSAPPPSKGVFGRLRRKT